MNGNDSWDMYKEYLYVNELLGLTLDVGCMNFAPEYFKEMEPKIQQAFLSMRELEKGEIANPDEKRMVGHYWLRDVSRAPNEEIRQEINDTIEKIKKFVQKVKKGSIVSSKGKLFTRFLLIGIGGSALGPQLLSDALGKAKSSLKAYYFDNTDPDGMDRVMSDLADYLEETMVIVISKSGGTVETCNGMQEIRHCFSEKGIDFTKHVVAVTTTESKLDKEAQKSEWLARFYIWDWVGGRTSIASAVGLLPVALQGIDIDAFINGMRDCDEATRNMQTLKNPAAILALTWNYALEKRGKGNMVVLPYRDKLQLFSRYLQQLVMESLGKEKDLNDNTVHQGITVYGNKGSTDQHAYVQQLLDGVEDSFVTFIEVKKDQRLKPVLVDEDVTSGDYLKAFLEGTRRALKKKGRDSLTIGIEELNPYSMGVLIALFERTVGLYANLINVNAYNQPGVELGKKSANTYIDVHHRVLFCLRENKDKLLTVEEVAKEAGIPQEVEFVYKVLERCCINKLYGVKKEKGKNVFSGKYGLDRGLNDC